MPQHFAVLSSYSVILTCVHATVKTLVHSEIKCTVAKYYKQ